MKKNLMPTIVLSTICIVVALLLSAINMITAPIIEKAEAEKANGALLDALPNANPATIKEVEDISELPAEVTQAWTSDAGYIFKITYAGYNPGNVIMVGVDTEGKIASAKVITYADTYEQYKGIFDIAWNDSNIDDIKSKVELMTTATSVTGKGVSKALEIAINASVLVGGGELSPSIILKGMIPTLAPGFASGTTLKCEEIEASGNITNAFKAINESGFAFVIAEGETSYLALVNAVGSVKVYDVEGKDVTSDKAAIVDEAKAASAAQTDYAEALRIKIGSLMKDATDITPAPLGTFTNVVAAAEFKVGDATYYGFCARPLSYGDAPMDIYVIVDADGKIVKQDIAEMLFGHGVEYLPVYGQYGDPASSDYQNYENGFAGLNKDTVGNHVMISGATVSSTAVKTAMSEVFAAFEAIKGGTN